MLNRWQKAIHVLAQSRLEMVFPAIANNWLVVFMARHVESGEGANPLLLTEPLWCSLLLSGTVAAGLSIYALVLNDVMDARHDRAFSPERPIPAGRLGQRSAAIVAFLSLLAAFGAAAYLGVESALMCVLAAVAMLFYNALGKFFPGVGITTLGLTWAVGMAIPNPRLTYGWPLWLTMTHVIACTVAVHVIEGKRPRLHAGEWLWIVGGWAFWTFVLLLWMNARNNNLAEPGNLRSGLWVGPLVAIAALGVATWWTFRGKMGRPRTRHNAGRAFREVAMLWLIAYDAAWLLSAEDHVAGFVMLGIFGVALLAMRLNDTIERLLAPAPSYRVSAEAGKLG